MNGGTAPDVLVVGLFLRQTILLVAYHIFFQVAHGHILRAFVKRWLKYAMSVEFTMMMEPGAIGVLSYAHHNVEEPAILVGMGFPNSA